MQLFFKEAHPLRIAMRSSGTQLHSWQLQLVQPRNTPCLRKVKDIIMLKRTFLFVQPSIGSGLVAASY